MPPALSLMFQTAWHAAPYSLQHTVAYSQALSMNPFGIHLAVPDGPACFFSAPECNPYGNVTHSDNYINMSNEYTNMQTDENGEGDENEHGKYLNMKTWKLLDIHKKTDTRGRVHANEIYYNTEIRVFVSDVDQDIETCKNYFLLPFPMFAEITKSREKSKAGEPLKVQINGDVWTGSTNKNKYVKIFVKV